MRKTYDVCCAVVSDLEFDARVWKEVRTLSAAGYRVLLVGCCYERSGRRYVSGESVDVVEVSLGSRNGKVSVVGRMQTLARIWVEILRTRAHAYHCHNIHVGPPMWLASRLRNKPLVYDGHELYGAPRRRTLSSALAALPGRAVEGAMVRNSDAVVTTNTVRAGILERRWRVSGVHVLGNVPRVGAPRRTARPGVPHGGPGPALPGRPLSQRACVPRVDPGAPIPARPALRHPRLRTCIRFRARAIVGGGRLRVVAGALSATATVRRTRACGGRGHGRDRSDQADRPQQLHDRHEQAVRVPDGGPPRGRQRPARDPTGDRVGNAGPGRALRRVESEEHRPRDHAGPRGSARVRGPPSRGAPPRARALQLGRPRAQAARSLRRAAVRARSSRNSLSRAWMVQDQSARGCFLGGPRGG